MRIPLKSLEREVRLSGCIALHAYREKRMQNRAGRSLVRRVYHQRHRARRSLLADSICRREAGNRGEYSSPVLIGGIYLGSSEEH
jgi:hypothetical protein